MNSYIRLFDTLNTQDEIGYAMGILNTLACSPPIDIQINNNCAGKCCIFIGEPNLGLPTKHYYTQVDAMTLYKSYLTSIGELFHIPHFQKIIDTERRFLDAIRKGGDDHPVAYTYAQLIKEYSHIPWKAILEGYGMEESVYTHHEYRISNEEYLKQLHKEFHTIGRIEWVRWLQSILIHAFIEYLPPPFSTLRFDLYDHFIKGIPRKLPRQLYMLQLLNEHVPQLLGSVCVSRIFSEETKHKATDMIRLLKTATHTRIANIPWMHAKTRGKALEKIDAMLFQVGYPKHWRLETDKVVLYSDRLLTNIWNISREDTVRDIRRLVANKCGRDSSRWQDSVFNVNAYYYPDMNMMTIPAGSLMPPFFDVKRSEAWNLGGIGVIIGHEISHGFDDDGRTHDKDGNCKNWWLPRDEKTYHTYTKKIIDLFDGLTYEGGKVDGKRTLDENIADLCGVATALGALNTLLVKNPKADRIRAYRDFFTSYATSWRTKDRAKKALYSLQTSVHAPAKLRVNCIVGQFDEFYEGFGIRSGDPGWIEPAKRIRIW